MEIGEGKMNKHGDHDLKTNLWFCSYWMNIQAWIEIHGYTPHGYKGEEGNE